MIRDATFPIYYGDDDASVLDLATVDAYDG